MSDKSFSSTIGWSGSKPINAASVKLGRTNGGWGSGGKPNTRGAAAPMPKMPIPTGPKPCLTKQS
jgi:hypothetical protein